MSRPARVFRLLSFQPSPSLSLLSTLTPRQPPYLQGVAPSKSALWSQPHTSNFGRSRIKSLLYSTGLYWNPTIAKLEPLTILQLLSTIAVVLAFGVRSAF